MASVKPELQKLDLFEIEKSPQAELARLYTGDNLSRSKFLQIWEQLPNVKQAELIEGIVYMPSPVGLTHGVMVSQISYWLSVFAMATPHCQTAANVTWLMGDDSAPQPDVFLRILTDHGGQSGNRDKFPTGSPELAVEIASSSVAYDLHQKQDLYRDQGVQEYLGIVLQEPEIRWHRRVSDRFELLTADATSVYRSIAFPGLWLNGSSLLSGNMKEVLATLQQGINSSEHAAFVHRLSAGSPQQTS